MAWQRLDPTPIDIDSGISAARANAIASALAQRAVPLLSLVQGRAEPLASGAFYALGERLLLVTCRHVFDDGVTVGDLGIPLPVAGRIIWLRQTRTRVLTHPVRDLAAIEIGSPEVARSLRRHWQPTPLADDRAASACAAQILVLAGYPYAQMRRVDAVVYARPLVLFAAAAGVDAAILVRYSRMARRIDGEHVHAPPLDGASGATLWAVTDEDDDGFTCVLEPAAIQYAFKHDAYVRAEPFAEVVNLICPLYQ